MALSRETIYVYLGSVYEEQTRSVWCALAVSEPRLRSFLSRMDGAIKTSWKGARLRDLSLAQMEDSRLEKIGASLLASLFSSNLADGLLLDVHDGSNAKNAFVLGELLRRISSMFKGQNVILVYDPSKIRAASINSALKKAGCLMKTEKTGEEDSTGLQIASFLAGAALESSKSRLMALFGALDVEFKSEKHFKRLDGDLLWMNYSLSGQAQKFMESAIRISPDLPKSRLLDTLIRKKADAGQYELLLSFLENGGSLDALEQASGSSVAAKIESLRQAESADGAKSAKDLPEPIADRQEVQKADEPLSETEEEPLSFDRQKAGREWDEAAQALGLPDGSAAKKLLFQKACGILDEKGAEWDAFNAGLDPAFRRPHAFIGCYKNPKTGREECAALIPNHSYYANLLKEQAGTLLRETSFPGALQSVRENSRFEEWIGSFFTVLAPGIEAEDYFEQLKSLILQIARVSPKSMIHMPLLTGQDLKAVLIEENWYLPYTLEREREQPLLRAARLQAAILQSEREDRQSADPNTGVKQMEKAPEPAKADERKDNGDVLEGYEAKTEVLEAKSEKPDADRLLPKFILEENRHAALSDAQKKILSSPWLNTALTKRMADAFSRGLGAVSVSFVLWNEKGEAREWAVRSLLLEYLYPARTRSFLVQQQKVRTIDEYDFLSHPGFSLEKMQACAGAFDRGYPLEALRRRINQNSTLRAIEKAATEIPKTAQPPQKETSQNALPDAGSLSRPVLLGVEAERELSSLLEREAVRVNGKPQTSPDAKPVLSPLQAVMVLEMRLAGLKE